MSKKYFTITFITVVLTLLQLHCTTGIRRNTFDTEGDNWNPPVVTAMEDSSVNINESLTITATAEDDGMIEKYNWTFNGSSYTDTTYSSSLKVAYEDSGRQVVRLTAAYDDGVVSAPDSCVVTVNSMHRR